MTKVAIMQPTYLPWIGYFELMDACDVFVFLDCVQFDKRSWQQRNRIKTAAGELCLTVPVFSKSRRDQRIHEVEIDRSRGFADQHVRSLRFAYAKAPFLRNYIEGFEEILRKDHARLAALNVDLIRWIARELGIATRTLCSSELLAEGARVERLVSICKLVGADHYVSPAGARAYIEDNNIFAAHGIGLSYQEYRHPVYRQLHGEFLSHMSAVDLLFNEGEAALEVLRSGRDGVPAREGA